MTLALETLAVADRRRAREDWRALCEAVGRVGAGWASAVQQLTTAITSVVQPIVDFVTAAAMRRPGYYLRDGRWRRDHGYFRRRAKARRAALRAARRAR